MMLFYLLCGAIVAFKNTEANTALELIETGMSSYHGMRAHKTQQKLKHRNKQQSMQQGFAKEQIKALTSSADTPRFLRVNQQPVEGNEEQVKKQAK